MYSECQYGWFYLFMGLSYQAMTSFFNPTRTKNFMVFLFGFYICSGGTKKKARKHIPYEVKDGISFCILYILLLVVDCTLT